MSDKFIVPDTDVAALAALVNLRQLVFDASWYDDHVLDMVSALTGKRLELHWFGKALL